MKNGYKLLLAVILMIGVVGCGENIIQRKIEKSIAASLPETIGPADKYTVKASGSSMKMIHGRLNTLDITGVNVKFAAGIKVAKLTVNISDIAFDTDSKQITRVGATKYTVAISQAELNRYIAARLPDIPDLKIELQKGIVSIYAKPGISRLRVGVLASAAIEVIKQRILALDLKTLKVAGINTPEFARELVDSKLDTIFDANDLGFNAKIDSATITPGALTITGELDLIKLVKKAVPTY